VVSAGARETSAATDVVSRDAPGRPALAIIAAVASNAVIGAGNRLPWRIPADLRRFRALTSGHSIIMGRKTWESIGHPLPDRQNIVVSRKAKSAPSGAEIASSLDEALALVRLPPPAFCIGGGELYREALPRATTLHLTEVVRAFEGDVLFPDFDRREWREVDRESHDDRTEDPPYAFVTYVRR
jgi:dihydrofolate reductase